MAMRTSGCQYRDLRTNASQEIGDRCNPFCLHSWRQEPGQMGLRLWLIWLSDITYKLSMVNFFPCPIVQTRSGRSGNKESRSY